MTTPLDILAQQEARDAKWKALADAATSGPWDFWDHSRGFDGRFGYVAVDSPKGAIVRVMAGARLPITGEIEDTPFEENAAFIAASRMAVDALLADLARARAAIRCLVKQRDQILSRSWTQTRIVSNQNRYNAALLAILRGET